MRLVDGVVSRVRAPAREGRARASSGRAAAPGWRAVSARRAFCVARCSSD